MRTIKQLQVPQETDYNKFPNSTILNETDTTDGTPVVREIYGDLLTNIYAFCKDRGVEFNGLEDNEINGYQIVEALKLNVNKLNDVRYTLQNSDVNTFSIDIDFNLISDNYPIFAQATENMVMSSYVRTFLLEDKNGVQKNIHFNEIISSGDELLLIISDVVTIINLSKSDLYENKVELNIQGIPLNYSDSKLSDYFDNSDEQYLIFNDGTFAVLKEYFPSKIIRDIIYKDQKYFIFCIDEFTNKLHLYTYTRLSNSVEEVELPEYTLAGSYSHLTQMYVYGNNFAFSHNLGRSDKPNNLILFSENENNELEFISDITLDSSFLAPYEYFMYDDHIILSDGQYLYKYFFNGNAVVPVYKLKQNVVNLYTKNINDRFIQVDETAVKWK